MITNTDVFKQLLAKSDKKREIYISENSRYLNTIVIGTKNSGKTHELLPIMAKQDIENRECGATFIVAKKEIAYFLHAMARKHGRKVIMIKPSVSIEAENLLWEEKYNYDYINDNVINYKESIKKREIVIIDMEYSKYKGKSIKATAMLLAQLQLDMQEVSDTLRKPHFVYIDDAQYYIPYVETLLTMGEEFNIGTTILMQSRNQFKQKNFNFTPLIDNNMRNIILMNGINMTDIEYYQKQFYEHNINLLINRKNGQIIYETVDSTNTRRNGFGELYFLDEDYRNELNEKTIATRKKLTKRKRKLELGYTDVNEEDMESIQEDEQEIIIESVSEKEDDTIIEFIVPNEETPINKGNVKKTTPVKTTVPKQVIKKEIQSKKEIQTKKETVKKTPKQIIADDLDKMTNHFIICDKDFDFEDEY